MPNQPSDRNVTGAVPKGPAKKALVPGTVAPGRTGGGGESAVVSHERVRGGTGRAEALRRPAGPAVYGVEYLAPGTGRAEAAGGAESMRAVEARAVPAGQLSYGESLASKFERLKARLLDRAPAPRGPVEFSLESLIGDDDRDRVDPSVYPYSAVCYLVSEFTLQNGRTIGALGTGWIIGRRTVITAGHCVYAHDDPKLGPISAFADRVAVYPACDGAHRPYEFLVTSESLQTTQGWVEQQSEAADYAAIIVNQDLPEEVGVFGYGPDLDASLRDGPFRVTGYPGELEGDEAATQWEHAGTVRVSQNGRRLLYAIDTTPGQSGAPVHFINRSADPAERFAVAVGIHNYGDGGSGFNRATYIVGEVLDNLNAWKQQGGG
jgi:glutamyl endopeptidase